MNNELLLKADRKDTYIDVCHMWTEEEPVSCSCDPFCVEADWCPRFNESIEKWRQSDLEFRRKLCPYSDECSTSSCDSSCGSYNDYFKR